MNEGHCCFTKIINAKVKVLSQLTLTTFLRNNVIASILNFKVQWFPTQSSSYFSNSHDYKNLTPQTVHLIIRIEILCARFTHKNKNDEN